MKKIVILFLGLLIVILVSSSDLLAQRGIKSLGSEHWGAGDPFVTLYDPETVETIEGEVVSVDKMIPMKGMAYGVYLILKTETEEILVHLGPLWYIEHQDQTIQPKDRVWVTGSRITFGGKQQLLAAAVKKGNATLILRDENHQPVWCGWRCP